MALKNSQYYALMREYEQTRLKNHDLQMKRYEEVYKKIRSTGSMSGIRTFHGTYQLCGR